MKDTYWNNRGKYQTEYDRLVYLMPAMDNADTVAGELIRAASRLAYDLYNNGMGNNTSGAVNYLLRKDAIDRGTHRTIREFTRGRHYEGDYNGDDFQRAVERAVDNTIELILQNPSLETKANSEDLFDYQEPDEHWCDQCGMEIDCYSDLCSVCEDEEYCY